MLCATAARAAGCHGDSGSPLFQPGRPGAGAVLIGIVSWGAGSCTAVGGSVFPTVFTAIAPHAAWIDDAAKCLALALAASLRLHGCGGCDGLSWQGLSWQGLSWRGSSAAAGCLGQPLAPEPESEPELPQGCPAGRTVDCAGRCLSDTECAGHGASSCAEWAADGSCDDGRYGLDFFCAAAGAAAPGRSAASHTAVQLLTDLSPPPLATFSGWDGGDCGYVGAGGAPPLPGLAVDPAAACRGLARSDSCSRLRFTYGLSCAELERAALADPAATNVDCAAARACGHCAAIPDAAGLRAAVGPGGCGQGWLRDCGGVCTPGWASGDGHCDAGTNGRWNLSCAALRYDGGDCELPQLTATGLLSGTPAKPPPPPLPPPAGVPRLPPDGKAHAAGPRSAPGAGRKRAEKYLGTVAATLGLAAAASFATLCALSAAPYSLGACLRRYRQVAIVREMVGPGGSRDVGEDSQSDDETGEGHQLLKLRQTTIGSEA